jgi:hypothetical protein
MSVNGICATGFKGGYIVKLITHLCLVVNLIIRGIPFCAARMGLHNVVSLLNAVQC